MSEGRQFHWCLSVASWLALAVLFPVNSGIPVARNSVKQVNEVPGIRFLPPARVSESPRLAGKTESTGTAVRSTVTDVPVLVADATKANGTSTAVVRSSATNDPPVTTAAKACRTTRAPHPLCRRSKKGMKVCEDGRVKACNARKQLTRRRNLGCVKIGNRVKFFPLSAIRKKGKVNLIKHCLSN